MNINDYLLQLLRKSSAYSLTPHDSDLIASQGIKEFIFSRLRSKKFRKYKMDPACTERTKLAVSARVEDNEPITVVFPQGGYKLWRLPSSPAADWAEFFTVAYMLEYIAPIAAAYKPGVQIIYYMHTLLMELHDNLTTDEIQIYVSSFESLLNEFRKYLPENVTVSLLRDADLYGRDEYFRALEDGKKLAEEEYKTWSEDKKNSYRRMSELNIKWKGKEDWTVLSPEEKENKLYLAALYEMSATSQLKRVFEIVKSPVNVLVFTKGSKDFIGIGSTRASIAKYWVGFGVLEKRGDSYQPVILTPGQYQKAVSMEHETVQVHVLQQDNYSEVLVFPRSFEFHKQ